VLRPTLLAAALAMLAPVAAHATAAGLLHWFDPSTAPFIPIPEIDTDPQSGVTLGLIPVWLRNNEQGEIERIIAPDVIRSQYFGWGSRFRVFRFPSPDRNWSAVGGLKQHVEREFDAVYADGIARTAQWSHSIETLYERSGTSRFYGLGNTTARAAESSFVGSQWRVDASLGRNFGPRLQLAWQLKLRGIEVLPGVLPGLASTTDRFARVAGVGNTHEAEQRLALSYDTRDAVIIPRSGVHCVAYAGMADRGLASSASYTVWGLAASRYWTPREGLTLAWHGALRVMPSARNAPFWALSSLGGDRSIAGEREPLRGYGMGRYVDRNSLAVGFEARTRVADFNAFATHVAIEIAPFVDLGSVYARADANPLHGLHHSWGVGFRAVASPYVVGYVDVGYGKGESAVFSGIAYPF
jgi:hypothetical protein